MPRKQIRVGFDLDGTLLKYPWPIAMYLRHMPTSIGCMRPIVWTMRLVEKMPVTLNGPLIDSIPKGWKVYIISARINMTPVMKQLNKYPFWINIYHRTNIHDSGSLLKAHVAKSLKLDYYFEDRISTIRKLQAMGVPVVDIYEVLRCLL